MLFLENGRASELDMTDVKVMNLLEEIVFRRAAGLRKKLVESATLQSGMFTAMLAVPEINQSEAKWHEAATRLTTAKVT